jgi:hypothetical protein
MRTRVVIAVGVWADAIEMNFYIGNSGQHFRIGYSELHNFFSVEDVTKIITSGVGMYELEATFKIKG